MVTIALARHYRRSHCRGRGPAAGPAWQPEVMVSPGNRIRAPAGGVSLAEVIITAGPPVFIEH